PPRAFEKGIELRPAIDAHALTTGAAGRIHVQEEAERVELAIVRLHVAVRTNQADFLGAEEDEADRPAALRGGRVGGKGAAPLGPAASARAASSTATAPEAGSSAPGEMSWPS